MATNCNPVLCPDDWARSDPMWRKGVLVALGLVIEAVEAGGGGQQGLAKSVATPQTATATAFGSLHTGSKVAIFTAATPAAKLTYMKFNNKLDKAVWISFDNNHDQIFIDVGEVAVIDLGSWLEYWDGSIYARTDTADPTVGSLYCSVIA